MEKTKKMSFSIEMQNSKEIIESARRLIKEIESLVTVTEENKLIEINTELKIENLPKVDIRIEDNLSKVLKKYLSVLEKINNNENILVSEIRKINFKTR